MYIFFEHKTYNVSMSFMPKRLKSEKIKAKQQKILY